MDPECKLVLSNRRGGTVRDFDGDKSLFNIVDNKGCSEHLIQAAGKESKRLYKSEQPARTGRVLSGGRSHVSGVEANGP